MDKKSIEYLQNTVKQLEQLAETSTVEREKNLLTEAKNLFEKSIEEWEQYALTGGFKIICNRCGNTDVSINCNEDEYETETYIKCNRCDNAETRWD